MDSNIISFIQGQCGKNPERIFISDSADRTVTYGAFTRGIAFAAEKMTAIMRQTRFCIALPNCAEFLYLLFGGISKGGIAVNLNPAMTTDEFRYRLQNAGVEVMYTTAEVYQRILKVTDELAIDCVVVKSDIDELNCSDSLADSMSVIAFKSFDAKDTGLDVPVNIVRSVGDNSPEEPVFFQYTGGTTGTIKAAMISHRNVLSSIRQMGDYLSVRLQPTGEVFLVTFPFYHVFSIVFQVLMAMRFNSRIVLYPYVRDLSLLKKIMLREPFTVFVGVHTLYKWLLQDRELSSNKYPSAKLFIAGAEHILPETKKRWLECTGHLIVEGYGLTETSALVSMSLLDARRNDIDGIGLPLPETEIKLVDLDGETVDEPDIAAEIWVRGPQVVSGYYNNEEDTAGAFEDGWLKTGDMAVKKANGQYKIAGRKKEMINVSGFNVFPGEVERVIALIPGVVECGVTGIPNDKSGERVAAYIVCSEPLKEADVIAHCREYLSAYKVPVKVVFPDELPKSAVGKTLRRELARQE